ncbi:MAG: hypothetical protein H6707_04000 [Deltaproteobacteria bacterium]|nr:hypothetical protein [Deltaproteobacteria bacterium]
MTAPSDAGESARIEKRSIYRAATLPAAAATVALLCWAACGSRHTSSMDAVAADGARTVDGLRADDLRSDAAGVNAGVGVPCGGTICDTSKGSVCGACQNVDATPALFVCSTAVAHDCHAANRGSPQIVIGCDGPEDCGPGRRCLAIPGFVIAFECAPGTFDMCRANRTAWTPSDACHSLADCPACAKRCEPLAPSVDEQLRICRLDAN